MATVIPPLWAESPELLVATQALAETYDLEVRPPRAPEVCALWLTPERLELRQHVARRTRTLAVDFAAEALAYRRRQPGFGEALAKAVGVNATCTPQVLDATAGWGRDAFLLAHWGCTVVMLERHPAVAALLADGLRRAALLPELGPQAARLSLIYGDAQDYLAQAGTSCDVVYLDPMFPPRQKTALVKQELQALQMLVGAQDASALWRAARVRARKTVLKRPVWAAPTTETPNFSVGTGAVRFEVFLGRD